MSARKSIRKRKARQIARFRAGLIVESAIQNGYGPDDLLARYGEEGLKEIISQLEFISAWLIDTGTPE